ncbi:MAG: 2-oxoglutarate/2-oxoacid ferredoxin oxidoreductase subunit alpha [Bacteroidota bacterium]|nr:2-oxoglutarate/2-oxoacid ferredoxin oxidoreductase subunit alpha [Bacteroidota bacterium]
MNNRKRTEYLNKLKNTVDFIQGDEAAAYGAIYAGCNFFAGYPITPASEVAELMAKELPKTDGYYIQMEDEIASIGAVIGSVWAGGKSMTATSGPGFSLMQEHIGYACMTETPCVIVNVQRSGPSTGQATKAAQGDVMQARWGTHGDHEMIALSPNSVQETFDIMLEAFNLSETYRNPVIVLLDGEVGHIREKIVFPDPETLNIVPRNLAKGKVDPFGGARIPPMVEFGMGQNVHVTGSTHKANGMRDVETQPAHDVLIRRIYDKIDSARDDIVRYEENFTDDYDVLLLSFGATARPSMGATLKLREEGIRAAFLRLITIWPFPRDIVRKLCSGAKQVFVPEMNLGQISREIERYTSLEVNKISKIGGVCHTIEEIYSGVKQRLK